MPAPGVLHEVLCAVFEVRAGGDAEPPGLSVLLWQRGEEPQRGSWSLPGGLSCTDEDLETSARRQLAEKVDLREVAHLEQLAVFSAPDRVPGERVIASTYLGLVPSDSPANLPDDTRWHPVDRLPDMSFDHRGIVELARTRLSAKISYTNIAFALAPAEFSMSELSDIYGAALGYPVDSTNLLRILSRRGVVGATGTTRRTGRTGGRPPALYRFTERRLRVTDEFATLRPPP
ncbi:NUDIX hydrolase [Williamsia sterculiae]|uniref:ADP-ribose pyrophosphatase YjhB, NUDIX family n=1 Tax=Williamsia sterculiae TaxID=1344003 RepID=A0A1N7H5W4_9NOCA|nr:NUDIX domain-containing protein [Williamsia sterculiae]SIS20274.1 ADP-ribose pyrophosphatase YjhB, NUDIX family [Williamsia sterculiae]